VRALLLLITLCFSLAVSGQNRPKVGLALSGGGAKSMAQLGALRAIEEAGIKIDYISGSSMGAVIGAMYSMGYTVDEIEATLAMVDWDQLLSNDIPQDRLPYLNHDDEKYLISVAINKGKFQLPKAFNYGHYMLKVLSYLSMHYHDLRDFEQLPIPFLCMATDLETGESVVFDKGNLTDALRASVAYPSIFSPYEIKGRLYVDGGVRNNLPIAVLKELKGMDYVIAIDVQGQLYKTDELTGIIQVMEQVGSFPNMLFFEEQKKFADVLVRPEIDAYDIRDYEATDTIIKLGYSATKTFAAQLSEIAAQQNAPILTPIPGTATPMPFFKADSIQILGGSKQDIRLIKSRLGLKDTGTVDLSRLDRGLDLLYGSNRYDKVEFQYINLSSIPTAQVTVKKKPSRQSVRFGLHYDDDFSIALLANYTLLDAGLPNSIFLAEVAISENPRGQIAYLAERGYVPALGMRNSFYSFQPRLYANQEPIAQFNFFTNKSDVFLHSSLSNNYTLGTGIRWDYVEISETIDILGLDKTINNYLVYHAFIDFDSYNRSFRPSKGFILKGNGDVLWRSAEGALSEPTSVFALTYNHAFSFTSKFGMQAGFSGAATIGPDADYPYNVFVGGLGQNYINFTFPFVGYRFMELIGRNFASINAWAYYEIYENHFITLKGNIGAMEGTFTDLFSSDIVLDGYGLSYAYNSPIGPLELTVMGSTNTGNIYTYISLGFWF
jgi:NTE family protein